MLQGLELSTAHYAFFKGIDLWPVSAPARMMSLATTSTVYSQLRLAAKKDLSSELLALACFPYIARWSTARNRRSLRGVDQQRPSHARSWSGAKLIVQQPDETDRTPPLLHDVGVDRRGQRRRDGYREQAGRSNTRGRVVVS
jgi:hypothetical protein